MEGAELRMQRARELTWVGAMLPWLKTPISLEAFVGSKVDEAARVKRFHAAWDKIDRALARNK